jgi:hypothetical protein
MCVWAPKVLYDTNFPFALVRDVSLRLKRALMKGLLGLLCLAKACKFLSKLFEWGGIVKIRTLLHLYIIHE